jgi:hypothetical protein
MTLPIPGSFSSSDGGALLMFISEVCGAVDISDATSDLEE